MCSRNDEEPTPGFILLFCWAFVGPYLFGLFGFTAGKNSQRSQDQKEAVAAGVAAYRFAGEGQEIKFFYKARDGEKEGGGGE